MMGDMMLSVGNMAQRIKWFGLQKLWNLTGLGSGYVNIWYRVKLLHAYLFSDLQKQASVYRFDWLSERARAKAKNTRLLRDFKHFKGIPNRHGSLI